MLTHVTLCVTSGLIERYCALSSVWVSRRQRPRMRLPTRIRKFNFSKIASLKSTRLTRLVYMANNLAIWNSAEINYRQTTRRLTRKFAHAFSFLTPSARISQSRCRVNVCASFLAATQWRWCLWTFWVLTFASHAAHFPRLLNLEKLP